MDSGKILTRLEMALDNAPRLGPQGMGPQDGGAAFMRAHRGADRVPLLTGDAVIRDVAPPEAAIASAGQLALRSASAPSRGRKKARVNPPDRARSDSPMQGTEERAGTGDPLMEEAETAAPDPASVWPPVPRQEAGAEAGYGSGEWFCPYRRCCRRVPAGACPRGWAYLASLVGHMLAVHLSAGHGPPAAWLDSNRLQVCAPSRDLAPAVGRCTGARCTVTTLASVASGNSPVKASLTTPLDALRPSGLDIVALLGAAGPVRRRVPL